MLRVKKNIIILQIGYFKNNSLNSKKVKSIKINY